MKKIEQIAIGTKNPEALIENLKKIGLTEWVKDYVMAEGEVFGEKNINVAELNFNYQLGFELEILRYLDGRNWHNERNTDDPFLSHLGYHATHKEVEHMRKKMEAIGVGVAQEVWTKGHTNSHISGKRRYHYIVFDSKAKIGFDLKLIERFIIDEVADPLAFIS